MDGLTVKLTETPAERQAAYDLRVSVFVGEQGIPVEEELDELDARAVHAIATLDGTVVGTGRLVMTAGNTPEPGQPIARIGRMAVAPERRRQGIGTRILAILESVAREHEVRDAVLHAQTYVKDFYAAQGYAEEGGPFQEADIEHVRMVKDL